MSHICYAIIPVHNEATLYEGVQEDFPGQVLKGVCDAAMHEYFNNTLDGIVFVDDGSTDGTLEIVQRYHHPQNNMYVVSHQDDLDIPQRRGKMEAFLSGFSIARSMNASMVVTLDGDLRNLSANDIELLAGLIKFEKYSMSIGCYYQDLPGHIDMFNSDRRLIPQEYSGFRAFKVSILNALFDENHPNHQMYADLFSTVTLQHGMNSGFGLETALETIAPQGRVLYFPHIDSREPGKGAISIDEINSSIVHQKLLRIKHGKI